MPVEKEQWAVLADNLPATLVTNQPDTGLKPDATPSCTGIDPDTGGYLTYKSSCPSKDPSGGTIAKTVTIGAVVYSQYYSRLWLKNATSTNRLQWGAPNQYNLFLAQGIGEYDFNEDATAILKFMPFGGDKMAVFKSTGAYIVGNANAHSGRFTFSDIIQEAPIAAAANAVELDGIVYFNNTTGLFALLPDGRTIELSEPIRDLFTGSTISPAALTCDYKKKWVILGSALVYDTRNKKLFRYSGSTFAYQTRALSVKTQNAVSVEAVVFEFVRTAETTVTLKFRLKYDDRDWSEEYEVPIVYERGAHQHAWYHVSGPDTGKNVQLQISSFPSTVKLRRILARYTEQQTDS